MWTTNRTNLTNEDEGGGTESSSYAVGSDCSIPFVRFVRFVVFQMWTTNRTNLTNEDEGGGHGKLVVRRRLELLDPIREIRSIRGPFVLGPRIARMKTAALVVWRRKTLIVR